MPKYITKPSKLYWNEDVQMETPERMHLVVFEDHDPVDTGLLDAFGNYLYRLPEREPIGFQMREGQVNAKRTGKKAKKKSQKERSKRQA